MKNAYTKSTEKYDYKGTVMELKSSVKEDEKKMEKLSDILGKPMLLAAGFDSGSDMTKKIEDQMRTQMTKQVEAKQSEAKAQMEEAQMQAAGEQAKAQMQEAQQQAVQMCRYPGILIRWISMIC